MLAPTPNSRPSPLPLPAAVLAAELGNVVMADDPCEATFGSATPTGPRNYYRARYYDPKIGRFLSEDPVSAGNAVLASQYIGAFDLDEDEEDLVDFGAGLWPEDVNLYTYVYSNPVNFTDPTGESPAAAAAAARAAAAAAARAAVKGGKWAWQWWKKNVHWDAASPGFQHSQGRMCQVRVKNRIVFRVDLHTRTPGGPPRWHVHIFPPAGGEHGLTLGRK